MILDEAHYLADEDRGHVWEEAIILTPPRIRMLLLSATVGRAEEFARWIEEVRGTHVRVINRAGSRPVELRAAYLSSNLKLFPLLDESGKFNPEIDQFAYAARRLETRSFASTEEIGRILAAGRVIAGRKVTTRRQGDAATRRMMLQRPCVTASLILRVAT